MSMVEINFKDKLYILKFLQSNFHGIKNESNLKICEKVIQLHQLSIIEELKNKQDLLVNLLEQNQKLQVKYNQYNQLRQNITQLQQKQQEQIIEVQKQIEIQKLKQQNQHNANKKQTFENLEQLQLRIDQRRNDLKICQEMNTEIQDQLQFKKEEINKRIQFKEIDFLLDIQILPQLAIQQQELKINYNQQLNLLENLKKYLQKYQGNNSQLNQINEINEDINKIQNTLKFNLQRQECLKEQINNLQQAQGYKITYEELSQIILENEQLQLIIQQSDSNEQLQEIQVDINNLELEMNSQNNNNKLINLEQDLQNYNSEVQLLNEQQLDEIEVNNQGCIELEPKINELNQQIETIKAVVKNNQNNLEVFKKMKDQNNLLIDYNSELKEFSKMNISGKDIQTLEKDVKQLNEQLQRLEEILKLNQQLKQSAIIISELEQKLNNIKNEINLSHNCGYLDHDCDQICQGCNNPDIYCKFKAGHSNSTHLCENTFHFCKFKCNVVDCQNICQIEYDHKDNIPHNCLEYHQCHWQCNYCEDPCSFNVSEDHQVHQCQKKYCNHECHFMKNCFASIQCQNNCSKLHNEKHDIHICQNNHQCNFICDQSGICQIGNYTEKYTTKYTENGQFQYIIYVQNAQKKQCQYEIQSGMISHQGPHQCEKNIHSCDSRCPECNAYCDKEFGHKDKHYIHQHRNKEKQLFTLLAESKKSRVEIQEYRQEPRIYGVGESCYPETCSKSCQRRDRAHFHLIPCPGQGECLAITLNKENIQVARHQPKQYLGSNQIYDEILCYQYWEYYKWEHPVDKQSGQLISLCNYYCQKCDKELKQKHFCTSLAWHTDSNNYEDHQFSCSENHKFYGIDICFVIDSTETMYPYAQLIKSSINKFKNASDMYQKDQNAILYSIISYTDHDDQQIRYKNECIKYIDFTNHQAAFQYAKDLIFEYSDDYCEAMLDGLNKAALLKWRQNSQKYLFLIADAPPHGNFFYNQSLISCSFDNYPLGCPCGLKEYAVLKKLNEIGIKLVVLKLNNDLNLTIQVFQNIMKDVIVLNSSEEMRQENFIKKMEKMICECLGIEEITIGTD